MKNLPASALLGFFALASAALLTGCAHRAPQTTAGLGSQMPLSQSNEPGTLVYKSPTLDISKYHGLIIDPAGIYNGADANYSGITDAQKQELAAYLTSEYKRVLGEKLNIVTQPGPGIARLQLTLAGVVTSKPAASTILRLTPVGAGVTALKSLADVPASFTGSVTIAGEITDSQTGAVLAGFVGKESPQAYDLTSGLGTMRAAQLGCTRGAEEFRNAIARMKLQAAGVPQ